MPDQQVIDQPPQAPQAQPSMQTGLQVTGATPSASGYMPMPAEIAAKFEANRQKMSRIESGFQKDFAAVPKADLPSSDFHPLPPKESSEFFSLMMVMGALGGRSTHQPMVAAMNNMTAIMKGQKEGNDQMVAAQREQFKLNFDNAIKKYDAYQKEKERILTKYHWDMAAAQDELKSIQLEYGVDAKIAGLSNTKTNNEAAIKAKKYATDLKIIKPTLIKLPTGKTRYASYDELTNGLPAGATIVETGGKGATLGEERGAFQESNLRQANRDIERLEKMGTKMPIAGDIHIDSDGVTSAVGRFGVKRALTDEEQQLVAAAQLFAEASGHLSSGARLTQAAFQREIREFIQQPGDDQGVIAQKKANRENVLGAAKGVSGRTGDKLRAEQDKRWNEQNSGNAITHPDFPGFSIAK